MTDSTETALIKVIDELTKRRSQAANESVIFETTTGKNLARGRAYAYNEALEIVRKAFKVAYEKPDEFKEQGMYP
jgi:hypothetical protein